MQQFCPSRFSLFSIASVSPLGPCRLALSCRNGVRWLPSRTGKLLSEQPLLPKLRAYRLDMPVCCQIYLVRALIAQDFPGTMKMLGDAGFRRGELCSPAGYAKAGFGDARRSPRDSIRWCTLQSIQAGLTLCRTGLVGARAQDGARRTWRPGLKEKLAAAKVGGIRNYFVEMNLNAMKASVPYLRRLTV